MQESGELAVDDVCVPGIALLQTSVPRPIPGKNPSHSPVFLLLISGLSVGASGGTSPNLNQSLALQVGGSSPVVTTARVY
jgi:hypothetical protein